MEIFGVDWSDGWAGNITAEAVGVVFSLLVAYLVADRVVRWRLQQERRPAKDRLLRSLASGLDMLNYRLGRCLGILEIGEIGENSADVESRVRAELEAFTAIEGTRELRDVARELVEKAERMPGLSAMARGILEDIGRVSQVADRYANIVAEDARLQVLIADLEDCGSRLEKSLVALPGYENAGLAGTGKLGLVSGSTMAFERGRDLRRHLRQIS